MKSRSLFIHALLTVIFLWLFFGKLLPNLNQTYFSRGGDGFRTYFGIYFHAKYDTTNYRLDGMNYPFGEMIGFTDCQPPVSNTIRFISNNIVDVTQYTTGIINGLMLFSFFLASIFLFLILRRMKLPPWYATVVALCIVLLSPQIQRIGGHFSLGWMLWVPMSIYLLMVFNSKRSVLISALICLFALLSGSMHFYFLAFWIFLFGLYWMYRWIFGGDYRFQKSDLLYLFIQVLLPVILLQLNLIINDVVIDRTANPWGFYTFRGQFPAVFLPLFKSYIPFIENLRFAKKIQWEAFCYIGIVASVGFFILFFRWIFSFIKMRKAGSITGNRLNDFLFWSSFLVLLFSFGLPFTLGLDKLRQFIGPLGQLRGVARFGWLFYYVINIVVFTKIYFAFFEGKENNVWKKVLVFVFLGIFAFEGWSYSGKYQYLLLNSIPEYDGNDDSNLGFYCKSNINPSEYQAVLPLPYFHIGSESIWIESECDIMKLSFIVSMKTGLPNIGVMAARTSISQTYKNIELVRTPWKKFKVTESYSNKKAILLTVSNCDKLNADEKRLVDNAIWIGEHQNLKFYKLTLDSLNAIPSKYNYPEKYKAITDSIVYNTDSSNNGGYFFSTENFSKQEHEQQGVIMNRDFQRIMEAQVRLDPSRKCFLRFWVKDYDHDLIARTQLLVIQSTPTHQTLEEKYSDIFRHIRSFNDNWALIEIPIEPKQGDEIIKLLIKNPALSGKQLFFDEYSVSQFEF